ncbi:unnamed protein product [Trichogramma brassicae]|uniref:Uncharacterized protein n=1 Tax=Trichogramma brassicae TaxID=86971 RepID=A0A6H5I861_9HYME|nr:unnamed protein product [Trichogramma brassicae]
MSRFLIMLLNNFKYTACFGHIDLCARSQCVSNVGVKAATSCRCVHCLKKSIHAHVLAARVLTLSRNYTYRGARININRDIVLRIYTVCNVYTGGWYNALDAIDQKVKVWSVLELPLRKFSKEQSVFCVKLGPLRFNRRFTQCYRVSRSNRTTIQKKDMYRECVVRIRHTFKGEHYIGNAGLNVAQTCMEMGQTWCKEKSVKAQDSKSPLDRVFVRCAHRTNCNVIRASVVNSELRTIEMCMTTFKTTREQSTKNRVIEILHVSKNKACKNYIPQPQGRRFSSRSNSEGFQNKFYLFFNSHFPSVCSSSEMDYSSSLPHSSFLLRGHSIDSVDRPFHPSEWVDVNLEVPCEPRSSVILKVHSAKQQRSACYDFNKSNGLNGSSNGTYTSIISDGAPVPPPRRRRHRDRRPLPPKPDEEPEPLYSQLTDRSRSSGDGTSGLQNSTLANESDEEFVAVSKRAIANPYSNLK